MTTSTGWDGAANLHDLGGLPLRAGGMTAAGRVWRSGRPESVTETGWREAHEAGLVLRIDLRNPGEGARRPEDPMVADDALPPMMACPLEDANDEEFLEVCGPWLDHPRGWNDYLRLGAPRFRRLFEILAAASGPVLVHCSGGRDRTGIVSALLLALAGAEPGAIVDDYARGFLGASAVRGPGHAWDVASGSWVVVEQQTRPLAETRARLDERLPWVRRFLDEAEPATRLRGVGVGEGDLEAATRILTPF
jgi:protein-tyrosine phosphatase